MERKFPEGSPETRFDASPFVPDGAGLARLEEAAMGCRGCPLHADATQTVFGEGPASAWIMLIGEQPGDQEDRLGKPFVGPAGRILNEALEAAEIPRADVYVTNAVKHFKWAAPPGGGSRRLHQRPRKAEVLACKPWLEAEIAEVQPGLIVCFGATAAEVLLGDSFRVTKSRGEPLFDRGYAPVVGATIHPSAVLRARSAGGHEEAFRTMVKDLVRLREAAAKVAAESRVRLI
jgi:uracil-DNA glycosylase